MTAKYQTGANLFDQWRADVLSGTPPPLYPVSDGALDEVRIGPKLVTLIGGAPGAGKTALVMQCAVDALRLTPDLRVQICNVEMPSTALLDRQLARLSGVDAGRIRDRKFDREDHEPMEVAFNTLAGVADRLSFVRAPFDLKNVAESGDDFTADVIILDYIQRIRPPGDFADRRGSVAATMEVIREMADSGVAVVVVAAVSRQRDKKGRSSYQGDALNLASFRESSELEFGADDAFMLVPSGENDDEIILKHLKSRYGQTGDSILRFNRSLQRFEALQDEKGYDVEFFGE